MLFNDSLDAGMNFAGISFGLWQIAQKRVPPIKSSLNLLRIEPTIRETRNITVA